MKAIQRICKNGNSAVVTIPRAMMLALNLRLSDFVEMTSDDEGNLTIRSWTNRENVTQRSPGVLPAATPELPR